MVSFEYLFGCKSTEIQKICVLAPILSKGLTNQLRVTHFHQGKTYATGQNECFTFIYTQMGAPLLGDAILFLEETACEKIVLMGSCGLVKKTNQLNVGSIVSPIQCLNLESFSELLVPDHHLKTFYADQGLFDRFLQTSNADITQVSCATIGSLKLEKDYLDFFTQHQIDVVDMECSALFSASAQIKRQAIALLYATDFIGQSPYFEMFSSDVRHKIRDVHKKCAKYLLDFVSKL